MGQLGSHWMDFQEIWYLNIFRNSVQKCKFNYHLKIIMDTLHEGLCTCMETPLLGSSYKKKYFRKIVKKIETFYVQ
jgi:hypothetical protein